ncbi:MAG: hypothetical protein J6R59_09840 [Paludibacteraceae bacterium]|nr:hypothetical protein [Paludibacteraceae bacterium]
MKISTIVYAICTIIWTTTAIISKEKGAKISNAIFAMFLGLLTINSIIH